MRADEGIAGAGERAGVGAAGGSGEVEATGALAGAARFLKLNLAFGFSVVDAVASASVSALSSCAGSAVQQDLLLGKG